MRSTIIRRFFTDCGASSRGTVLVDVGKHRRAVTTVRILEGSFKSPTLKVKLGQRFSRFWTGR